jgi:hypothetical protein
MAFSTASLFLGGRFFERVSFFGTSLFRARRLGRLTFLCAALFDSHTICGWRILRKREARLALLESVSSIERKFL